MINVYTFGSDRVLLRDLHVNEVNAEQTSELIVGQKGYATVLNCNLCQVYDRAIFRVIGSTSGPTTIIDASENLPSATSASGSFDPVGRGVMRFVDMDLANLDLTAREQGTLELIGCTNAVVQNLDPGTTTVVETDFDAAFAASVLSGNSPLDVGFFDHSGGDTTTFAWTFGDGGSSSQQEPSYPYTSEGMYTVILTTIGPGQSDSQTRTEYIQVGIFADGFESGDTGAWQ